MQNFKLEMQSLSKEDVQFIQENVKTPPLFGIFIMLLFFISGFSMTFLIKAPDKFASIFANLLGFGLMGAVLAGICVLISSRIKAEKDINENQKIILTGKVKNKSCKEDAEGKVYFLHFHFELFSVKEEVWNTIEIGDDVQIHKSIHTGLVLNAIQVRSTWKSKQLA